MIWSNILIGLLVFIISLEFILFCLVHFLRKDFQWLILEKDELPTIPKQALQKFMKHGFDPELGWVRKANTEGREKAGTVGQKGKSGKETHYRINSLGARENPDHESLPLMISTFGDSFVFSRQVNDNESWQWYLSESTKSNVLNYGVGNYGVDQGLIRLKREYPKVKTQVAILGVVPESIVRIHSAWKHYAEYGNTFGFKPHFQLVDGKLQCIANVIDTEEKFYCLEKYLPEIKKRDYWYENKFRQDMLKFPYSTSLWKSRRRNVPLIGALVKMQMQSWLSSGKVKNIAWRHILERNFDLCRELYTKEAPQELFLAIIDEFANYGKQENFTPIFVLFPYFSDVLFIREHGHFYEKFIEQLKSRVAIVDPLEELIPMSEEDLAPLYSSDFYGGHLTHAGNKFMAQLIDKKLQELGIKNADNISTSE